MTNMDPISVEYFYTVDLLKKELQAFKHEQNSLKQKILKLYQKNKLLINELRDSFFIRDQELLDKNISESEHNITLAIAAKEAAVLLWQEAMQQLEKLEDQLAGRRSLVETEHKEVVINIEQIKEQYKKGVMTLSSELSNYRSTLVDVKQELKNKCLELEQVRNELKNVKEDFIANETRLSIISTEKEDLQEKIKSLNETLNSKSKLLSFTKKELDKVNSVNLELESVSADIKEQNKKLKYDVSILEKDAKESLFAAQEAILQKKELAYKEEQYIKDIEVLKSSGGIDVQKVELRCNLKINEIQKKNSEHVKSLMAEIEELHKENGAKESLFEKVTREKKAIESKFELLCADTQSFPNTGTMLDDLCNRLLLAEKARDEYELQVKSLQCDLEDIKSKGKEDTKRSTNEKNILKERLANLNKEFCQFLSDKIKLNEELSSLKKKCQELEKQLTFKQARQMEEISVMKSEAVRKQQSYNEKLHFFEQHYKTVCDELQTLLELQFKINKKWKEESEQLISQSESRIIELCDTIAQLQYQNTELVTIVQQNSSYK